MDENRPGYDVPVPVIIGGVAALGAVFGLGFSLMFRRPPGGLRGAPRSKNPWRGTRPPVDWEALTKREKCELCRDPQFRSGSWAHLCYHWGCVSR